MKTNKSTSEKVSLQTSSTRMIDWVIEIQASVNHKAARRDRCTLYFTKLYQVKYYAVIRGRSEFMSLQKSCTLR